MGDTILLGLGIFLGVIAIIMACEYGHEIEENKRLLDKIEELEEQSLLGGEYLKVGCGERDLNINVNYQTRETDLWFDEVEE